MGAEWHSSPAAVAKCLFCGAIGAWWSCHCEWAQGIRDYVPAQGRRAQIGFPKPRTVVRDGVVVIECCAELRAAARLAGVIRTVEKSDNASVTPLSVTESVVHDPSYPRCEWCGEAPDHKTMHSWHSAGGWTWTAPP